MSDKVVSISAPRVKKNEQHYCVECRKYVEPNNGACPDCNQAIYCIAEKKKEESGFSFSDIQKRNAENAERIRKERAKANQGVIRSHRLKHK